MERKINYVSGRDGALSIREFRGYGQSLSVLQGKSKLMIHVMPEDEELGIMIFHLQSPEEETTLRAPVVDIKNAKKVFLQRVSRKRRGVQKCSISFSCKIVF